MRRVRRSELRMRMRLIISEPDDREHQRERVQRDSPRASTCRTTADRRSRRERPRSPSTQTSANDVGIGVPSKYFTLPRSFGQRLGRDVVAREPRHAARDEEGQDDPVVRALQAARVAEHGGRDAERDHVGERVELAAQRGGLLAPTCDAAVEHVEDERREDQRAGRVDVRARPPSARYTMLENSAPVPQTALPSVNQSAMWKPRIIEKRLAGSVGTHSFQSRGCAARG